MTTRPVKQMRDITIVKSVKIIYCNTHLIPTKVVYEHHANEDYQHAEALEREHSHAKSAILLHHTGGVIFTVGTALLARQAVTGRSLIRGGTAVYISLSLPPHPCQRKQ